MSFTQRTHSCGDLRSEHANQVVTVNGWVHRVRDLGGLLFFDLRDKTGLLQIIFDPSDHPEAESIKPESCISVTGNVVMRDENARNPNLASGDIEVSATSYELLSPSGVLPFPVSDESQMLKVNEELRVKHRYLDLRRPSMLQKLQIRASAIRRIRTYLDAEGFTEIETPLFTKSTPEGARDYLVPYRLEPGKFYALPQSPQQYKQLLMVSGVEKYYQIARCFRDEAQRADRQPEFTQLDLEMSFVTQEDILKLTENMTRTAINGLVEEFKLDKEPVGEFVRMSYDESMERYGSDKPDLRFGLELADLSATVADSGFGVFKGCVEGGGKVRAIVYPGGSTKSRKDIRELEDFCKESGAKGLATIAVLAEGQEAEGAVEMHGVRLKSSIMKFLSEGEVGEILEKSDAKQGDLICIVADSYKVTNEALGRLRSLIGDQCGLKDKSKMAFAFILDFPLVDWNEDEERWDPSHHPFTSPKVEDIPKLESDTGAVRADCYDLVCNGVEWASGSIRIHDPELQARVFKLIGFDDAAQQERFGHILEAFSYGAPPHGGIAPGIDRMVMFLTDDENIREVIAFPKMGSGLDPLMDAPSVIDSAQWAEVGLQVTPPKED